MIHVTIDIGNTQIKLYEEYRLLWKGKHIEFNNMFKYLDKSIHNIVIISSVRDKISTKIINHLNNEFIIYKIEQKDSFLFNNMYSKNKAGIDRICGVSGVISYYKENSFVLLDLGTATVFSVVINKNFIGGYICPGIMTSFNSLVENAEKLKNIEFINSDHFIKANTENAVCSGTILINSYGIEGILSKIKEQSGKIPVFITGGNYNIIKDHIKIEHIYDDSIIAKGACSIYDSIIK